MKKINKYTIALCLSIITLTAQSWAQDVVPYGTHEVQTLTDDEFAVNSKEYIDQAVDNKAVFLIDGLSTDKSLHSKELNIPLRALSNVFGLLNQEVEDLILSVGILVDLHDEYTLKNHPEHIVESLQLILDCARNRECPRFRSNILLRDFKTKIYDAGSKNMAGLEAEDLSDAIKLADLIKIVQNVILNKYNVQLENKLKALGIESSIDVEKLQNAINDPLNEDNLLYLTEVIAIDLPQKARQAEIDRVVEKFEGTGKTVYVVSKDDIPSNALARKDEL
jgi:hypothetical protein